MKCCRRRFFVRISVPLSGLTATQLASGASVGVGLLGGVGRFPLKQKASLTRDESAKPSSHLTSISLSSHSIQNLIKHSRDRAAQQY